MKVVKAGDERPVKYRVFTLRLREETAARIDTVAEQAGMSRQGLIDAILRQVFSDPKFVLRVEKE